VITIARSISALVDHNPIYYSNGFINIEINMPIKLAGIIVLLLASTIAACGTQESNVDSGNRDGILHFGNGTEVQGLDPHVVTGVPENHLMYALFEGLVNKNPYTLEVEPGVAESWTVSEDGRVYEFVFRETAKWSNGEPVTAKDFEWSWWRALQPALGSQYVFMYFPIKNAEAFFREEIKDFSQVGIKALSDKILRIELANPTPYFLQLIDHYSMFAVHRATIEAHGKASDSYTQWTRPENFIGNGMFVLDEWSLNRHITVSRNENYWDIDKVKLNGIKFYPIDSLTTEERMFRAGQLHRTENIPIERIAWYRDNMPELLHIAAYNGTYFYRVNTRREPFGDVRVRRALAMTINRDLLIASVLDGIVTPSYSITPPGILGYQPPMLFKYDPEGARALLVDAGFPNGDGFPKIELQFNTSDQHRKIGVAIQQMWKKELNIDIVLQNRDWKVYLDNESTANFDLSRAGWIGDYVDPNTFLDMWITDGGVNRTGWGDPEFDRLMLIEAPEAADRDARFAKFNAAESLFMKNMPILPIYTYSSKHLIHESVRGMPSNVMDHYNYKYMSLQAKPAEIAQKDEMQAEGGE
jgi:oligopeptide transport system substrate-binding protein